MVQKPIWKPEYFPWVPPSHPSNALSEFPLPPPHIPSSHQDPIKIPSDGLLLAEACKCFKMGSKQCNSIKAIEGQHETSPKIRSHRAGHGPLSPTWNMGEISCFTRCSGGIHGGWKGCWFGQGRNGRATFLYPQKKKAPSLSKAGYFRIHQYPASSSKLLLIKTRPENLTANSGPRLPFLSAEKWPVKSR